MFRYWLCGAVTFFLLSAPSARAQIGTEIDYSLPATAAKVRVELALVSCADDAIHAVPTVTVSPIGGSSTELQRLIVTRPSWFQKRDLNVELFENGTIKSLNGGASDRTLDMAVSAVKIGVALAPMLLAPPPMAIAPPSLECSQSALNALDEARLLEARILTLRRELATAPRGQIEDRQAQITALAEEVARLKTGPLTLILEDTITFERSSGFLRWDGDALRKWLAKPEPQRSYDLFQIRYCALLAGQTDRDCQNPADRRQVIPLCGLNCVLIANPAMATLTVASTPESGFYRADGSPLAPESRLNRTSLAIGQWGSYTPTYFEAGFAEQWTTGMAFDAFGRQRSLSSTSDARGAIAFTAAQAISGDINAAVRTAATDSLAAVTSRTADLTARMELNRLRYCQAIIEAGGFVCPTAPAAPASLE